MSSNFLYDLQKDYPMIPLDGVAVSIATYILSPPKDKIRNTVIIGVTHYIIHEMICDCK